MANGLPGMPAQMPKFVLPRTEIMSQNPISALAEVRTSLSNTLANIESVLPEAPGAAGGAKALALPKLEEIFKGPAAAMKEIQTSLSNLIPAGGPVILENPAPTPAPTPTPTTPTPAPAVTGRRQVLVLRGMQ